MTARGASAGLLLFRRSGAGLEVFLAHPGGPFWVRRDAGAWTIPKGQVEPGEAPLAAARREFEEETGVRATGPFLPLGEVRQKAGKVVHAWAWEGEADAAAIRSNTMRTEWPRGSGRVIEFPEVDRCEWFTPAAAREKINPAQAALLDRLEAVLADGAPGGDGAAQSAASAPVAGRGREAPASSSTSGPATRSSSRRWRGLTPTM